MHLKSLTLRGFKSFASSTTLEFEPGITCVVGPNGSGKSNVVDALAWVMGEQGAKTLRGGKMEDVIFAGTAQRAPLGRAEVELTIDNSDGALPVELAEVTIARTMFRSGGSEYSVNGQPCRLLDVQELLSDSGIGREMHVVVGQGQLDSILQATPEERRGFVEEAAGVLKHRKRKEKALRKLDATEANLTRLQDLLTELRRQLKPLGKQAEVARRAHSVQADLRDSRARLLADDVEMARSSLDRDLADDTALRARCAAAEAALRAGRDEEKRLTSALGDDAARAATAQETWYHLAGVRERVTATGGLAAERVRRGAEDDATTSAGPDPDQVAADAERTRAEHARMTLDVEAATAGLTDAVSVRQQAEQEQAEEERRVAATVRAAADQREGFARERGRLQALRSRAEAAEDEIGRLTQARDEVTARAERARHDFTVLENQVAGLDAGEGGLDSTYEALAAEQTDLEERRAKLREEVQVAERARVSLQARTEALELGLSRRDGAGALLAADAGSTAGSTGVRGSLAALVRVRPGFEAAVAVALGATADAVVVDSREHAVTALRTLRDEDLGPADVLVATPGADPPGQQDEHGTDVSAGAPGTRLLDVVEAPPAVRAALAGVLAHVVVVDSVDDAGRLVAARPDLTAVTRAGDLLGRVRARGGSSAPPSRLELQAALEDATDRLAEATRTGERLRFALARHDEELAAATGRTDAALAELHESDAAMSALAEQLGYLGGAARTGGAEAERLGVALAEAEQGRDGAVAGLAELERRVAEAEAAPVGVDDGADLPGLEAAARTARTGETEARLTLRTAEERLRALAARVESLDQTAAAEREARGRAARQRTRRRREAAVAREVGAAVARTLTRLEGSLQEAAARRADVEGAAADRESRLGEVRSTLRDTEAELATLTDAAHRDELARAEQRLRLEALEQRATDELGLDAETLLRDYGTSLPVPAVDESADPRPYDRDEQTTRLRAAERALALLGKVNPLALEEYAALEERNRFLTEQLEDVRRTRRDLLAIVAEVDARVEQVFSDAYADVEREFAQVFGRLFPGGEGHLVLTEPADLLTTGVDVEARPPGKRVKRLSLLSGGERALVAVAFLVALFKARPSPFYILDEVEAALDDTNLGRLLEIYEELRRDSQLLVVTHQKRTMQVGDALYGVSMRGDGVSVVISQRLREQASA